MGGCPSVHEHPEFISSYDQKDKTQERETQKLKRFLKSDSGHSVGEQLKYELSPFKSFPRGQTSFRCIFILCKDCQKKVISPNCTFCGSNQHSMNDAVLFYADPTQDEAYRIAKKFAERYRPSPANPAVSGNPPTTKESA